MMRKELAANDQAVQAESFVVVSTYTPHVPNFLSNCETNIFKISGHIPPSLVNIQDQYKEVLY